MTQRSTFDRIFDAAKMVDLMRSDIDSIARAFARIGNEKLVEELYGISDTLKLATDEIRNAYSADLSQRVDDDMRAVGENLKAMIDAAS